MPTYEYACKACEHNFEIVQSFSEDTLTTCPECEQDALRKVYNAAGIIFKGDGWHIKDYAARSTTSAGASANGSSSEGSDGKGSTATTSSSSTEKKTGTAGSGTSESAARPAAG